MAETVTQEKEKEIADFLDDILSGGPMRTAFDYMASKVPPPSPTHPPPPTITTHPPLPLDFHVPVHRPAHQTSRKLRRIKSVIWQCAFQLDLPLSCPASKIAWRFTPHGQLQAAQPGMCFCLEQGKICLCQRACHINPPPRWKTLSSTMA